MKNLVFITFILVTVLGLSSCNKDINLGEFSSEEAAELIENALESSSTGIAEELAEITSKITESIENNFECGVTADTSTMIMNESERGSSTYDVSWEWTPACNQLGKMIALDFSSVLEGTHTSIKSFGTENRSSEFAITGLQFSDVIVVYNGTTESTGDQTIKVREAKEINYTLMMDIANLTVDKFDKGITEGSINFDLDVSLKSGEKFDFDGTVEFLGNRDATITINGTTYSVNL